MKLSFFKRLSINAKVALAYLGFVIIIGSAGTILVIHNEKSIITQGHIKLAQNLAENAQPVLMVEHRMMLNRLVQTVGKLPDVLSCAIINKKGKVVAHTDLAMIGRLLQTGDSVHNAFKEKGYYFEVFDEKFENVYVPVNQDDRFLGTIYASFEKPTFVRLFQQPGKATIENILIVILFTALIGLVGAYIIAKLISYPIKILTRKVYDVHKGRLPEKRLPGNYVYCWEQLNCKQTDCPSYGNKDEKCWTVAGTFCRGEVQGVFAQKIGDCRKCVIFKKNSGDEVVQLNDAFDLMVRDLVENTENTKEAKEDVENYARQLETANQENVDLKAYTERILNSLSSAVISMDENLVLRKYNRMAQSLLDVDLARIVGKDISAITKLCTRCNDFFGLILKDVEKYKIQGQPIVGHEAKVIRANGDQMNISMSVLPLFGDALKEETPLIVTFEDITDKEKMREELNLSRQLAELGEVAAKVAHDVRNPLNAIEGGIHYLISKYKEDGEIQNISNLIRGQVDRLNNVTSDLLKVSKPMVPNFNECDLNQLSEESTSYLMEEIKLAGLDLEKDYEQELPALCLDYNQIQRVIINLLENAIEAMPEGGTITLRTRLLKGQGEAGGQVAFSVSDSGPGIPSEILDSVFKPFYTTKLNGTGLGLAIVRQIIRNHQGEVKIRNKKPGPGAEVLFHIPLKMELKENTHAYSTQNTRHR